MRGRYHPPFPQPQEPVAGVSSIAPRIVIAMALIASAPVCAEAQGEAVPAAAGRSVPVTVRVEWGGGKPRAWTGTITVVDPDRPLDAPLVWRTTSTDADAAASVHAERGTIHVHDSRPRGSNGVEIAIAAWAEARIVVRLRAVESGVAEPIDVAVKDLLANAVQQQLDPDGNRLTIERPAADALRVAFDDASWPAVAPVLEPGGTLRFTVHPLLVGRAGAATSRELTMRVRDAGTGAELQSQTRLLRSASDVGIPVTEGLEARAYDPVAFEVKLPDREMACAIQLDAVERGSLRWSRPLVSRTVEAIAIATQVPPAPAAEWRVVHELDPGSPRLHERLRRLPGVPSIAVPNVPMPSIKLPSLPLPSMTRAPVSLPKLPNVPLPNVSAMVPRMSGLLASGHSVVEPHALGPMLMLPPSKSLEEPAWEGLVIAGAEVGLPHLVEIEYPTDQDAVFGVSVLETDARGALVRCRHAGGFEVEPPIAPPSDAPALGRHSFVFWPATKHPVVLVANASTRGPALFGKVRVFAGPERVPLMQTASPAVAAAGSGRGVHAFVASPSDIVAGGGGGVSAGQAAMEGNASTLLSGARRMADWLAAQGAAGAMVSVYARGGAIWPSTLTIGSRRWFACESGIDADMLATVCRVYQSAGLRIVPAVSCDAPLPALEALLGRTAAGAADATGIALVGRDGRPRRLPGVDGGVHYNILDPRVQQAVEELVGELADRLRGHAAVDGVAVLLSHEGWLHLPGVAWGLDDATFTRFVAAAGIAAPAAGPARFAERARLVEGPLREAWLDWRSREVAGFFGRLAALVSAADPRRSLYVTPTTLFAHGELSSRFRPVLAAAEADGDVWREIGLEPARLTAHERIVLLSPHVHATTDGLVEQGTVDNANQSLGLARSIAAAARRGVVAVEIPGAVSVREVVPHGPFGSAAVEGPVAVHAVRTGPAQSRALAESFVAADAEAIFDMSLVYAQPTLEAVVARRAFAALPKAPLTLLDPLPAPLVVRAGPGVAGAAVVAVNASGVPVRAVLKLSGGPAVVADAADGARLPVRDGQGQAVEVALGPWGVRSLAMDASLAVESARVEFDEPARRWVADRLADLRRQRAAVDAPGASDVLDNPAFDLPEANGAITGWELLEPRRGSLRIVADTRPGGGKALAFSSRNGLSTLRSNPFPPPATGRISVAMWLRLEAGDPQPPLRIALEGVEHDREFYRFASVGGLAGGKPLGPDWSQFVLQIDDLPSAGLESLRVRLDLLGPGAVQIDDVAVFDLAFDEAQRAQLSRMIATLEQRFAADDLGSCAIALDSYWPRFLAVHAAADAASAGTAAADGGAGQPGGQPMARPPRRWTWR